jgi:hypothetical protein
LEPGAVWGELWNPALIPALPAEVLIGFLQNCSGAGPTSGGRKDNWLLLPLKSAPPRRTCSEIFSHGSFWLQSISASDWFTSGSRFWSIGPTIRWPIFDAGRIRATIEVRNAQHEQALAQYKTLGSAWQIK